MSTAKTEKSAAKVEGEEKGVIVTTTHRGVFFGYTKDDLKGTLIELRRCRMAVHWSADVRGVIGLAAAGPTEGCRISPAADCILRDVTAVLICTKEAITAWEQAPWKE